VHFATKTHIKERLLSVGNVPKADVSNFKMCRFT
jgi:hypothetical protein